MKHIKDYSKKYWASLPLWLKCGMLAGVLKITIELISVTVV